METVYWKQEQESYRGELFVGRGRRDFRSTAILPEAHTPSTQDPAEDEDR